MNYVFLLWFCFFVCLKATNKATETPIKMAIIAAKIAKFIHCSGGGDATSFCSTLANSKVILCWLCE